METGKQIKRKISGTEEINYINAILEGEEGFTRTDAA